MEHFAWSYRTMLDCPELLCGARNKRFHVRRRGCFSTTMKVQRTAGWYLAAARMRKVKWKTREEVFHSINTRQIRSCNWRAWMKKRTGSLGWWLRIIRGLATPVVAYGSGERERWHGGGLDHGR